METHVSLFNRLLRAASKPEVFNGINLKVTASMGVTFYPQTVDIDPVILIRQADQAMYQAKLAGRNSYRIFDTELNTQTRSQHESLLKYSDSTSSE
jgi:FOG: GGDEF domain